MDLPRVALGKGASASGIDAGVGPLSSVRYHVRLEVVAVAEALGAALQFAPERLLARVDPLVLAQVAQGGEELGAVVPFALESGPVVNPLVSFETVERCEGLVAAGRVAFKGPVLGVHPDVDLEAVRIEERLAAALLVALESVLACDRCKRK